MQAHPAGLQTFPKVIVKPVWIRGRGRASTPTGQWNPSSKGHFNMTFIFIFTTSNVVHTKLLNPYITVTSLKRWLEVRHFAEASDMSDDDADDATHSWLWLKQTYLYL